jgi:hypothetical protein
MPPGPEKDKYILAWSFWRLPYWNWAIPQPYIQTYGVPEIFTQEIVANGPNPLWKFTNPKLDSTGKPAQFGDKSVMGRYYISQKEMHLDFNVS